MSSSLLELLNRVTADESATLYKIRYYKQTAMKSLVPLCQVVNKKQGKHLYPLQFSAFIELPLDKHRHHFPTMHRIAVQGVSIKYHLWTNIGMTLPSQVYGNFDNDVASRSYQTL
jgi:hypothetical protein